MQITPDLIMSTIPCVDWPRERVEGALAQLDTSSWTALVESAIRDDWRVVSLPDLLLTLCRVAAQHYLSAVLTPRVVEVIHARVAAQRPCSNARQATKTIWDRLAAWRGDREEIREIHRDAVTAYAADPYAAYASAAYAVAAESLPSLARRLDAVGGAS